MVIIEIDGGYVQEIYTDDPTQRCIIVDWDNIKEGDSADYFPAKSITMLPKETKIELEAIDEI